MDATVATVLGIIGALMTVISILVAVFTFYFNRKKDSLSDGEFKGQMETDIKYIKDGIDDMKDDFRDVKDDIHDLDHRVTLVEASVKSAHHRLDAKEESKK